MLNKKIMGMKDVKDKVDEIMSCIEDCNNKY
jgi:hypothetical protein